MTETSADASSQGWRSRTVERSLQTARARAVNRGSRFIAAAQELLAQSDRPDFTLQDVVDHARSSMRTFYLHFASKDDLLIAVLEEEMYAFAQLCRDEIAASKTTDPRDHLKVMIDVLLSEISSDSRHGRLSRALTIYYMHLFETSPEQLSHAIKPQYDMTLELVQAGVDAGVIRTDIAPAKLAELFMRLSSSVAHSRLLGNELGVEPIDAQEAWLFCLGGLDRPRTD